MNCDNCGEELDDFSNCQCSFDPLKPLPKPKLTTERKYSGWGMRQMVERKLQQKARLPTG